MTQQLYTYHSHKSNAQPSALPEDDQPCFCQEHRHGRREHVAWLTQIKKSQLQSRRVLALLTRIESIVRDRDAELEALSTRIETHEAHIQLHDIQIAEPDLSENDVEQEKLAIVHERFRQEHEAVRKIFEGYDNEDRQYVAKLKNLIDTFYDLL